MEFSVCIMCWCREEETRENGFHRIRSDKGWMRIPPNRGEIQIFWTDDSLYRLVGEKWDFPICFWEGNTFSRWLWREMGILNFLSKRSERKKGERGNNFLIWNASWAFSWFTAWPMWEKKYIYRAFFYISMRSWQISNYDQFLLNIWWLISDIWWKIRYLLPRLTLEQPLESSYQIITFKHNSKLLADEQVSDIYFHWPLKIFTR